MKKELKRRVQVAEAAGWRVEKRDTGHVVFYPADKSHAPITASGTPSDWRAWRNLDAALRRAGLHLPWKT